MKIPTFHRNVITCMVRSIAVPCLLFAAVTPAFGLINGSFVVNGDNSVTYSYEVDNSGGSFDIAIWALEFSIVPDWNQLDAPFGDVTVPNQDWVASAGIPASGLTAQDFLSLGAVGDVLINSTLSGFSFTSVFLPGPIEYHEFSATGESATGQTIGPAVAPAAVPDSSSRAIEAMALIFLAAVSAGRKLNRGTAVR
jgi:hypothetical protein